ncbi:MAG TPA: AI-2E family transporter [Bacillota bacterium]|nr:AI-2E family transporter [Bacillota bacterium]HPO98065.1 AI-2E family transporter [Bacillota bacterium]
MLFIALVIYLSRSIILPFVLSFFLAYAINPLVEFLEKKGAKREWAIITIYLSLFLASALALGILIPRLLEELSQAIQRTPLLIDKIKEIEQFINQIYSKLNLPYNFSPITTEITHRGELLLRQTMVDLIQGIFNFLSQSLMFLLVPWLSYYFSRDYPDLKGRAYEWLLTNLGVHWTKTFLSIDHVFKSYIRGQLLVTIIVGFLIGLGLSLLGFEIALFLGLMAGIFNLIPYFGPIMGALPAIVFGLTRSPWHALYVIVLFFIINQIEVMILAPRIIGKSLGLNPVFIIFLILVGGKLLGLWGMVFAVPLGTIIWIIIKSLYEISFGLVDNETILEKQEFNDGEFD